MSGEQIIWMSIFLLIFLIELERSTYSRGINIEYSLNLGTDMMMALAKI